MAELGTSLLAVAAFAAALWRLRVGAATESAVRSSTDGLMAMLDVELDDAAKEVAVRRAGVALIVAGLDVLWRFVVALLAAALPVLLADRLALASRASVVELLLRVDVLVVVSVLAVGVAATVRRRRPAAPTAETAEADQYSTAERFLHAVAFSRPGVLRAASRLEDRVLSEAADTPTAPPIFITSLARAGTTALLNAVHDVPGVATHTYRDMPFLTAPTLWNRLAGGDRRRVDRRERAHGDGLEIDLDSPEAFEEVVWRLFWPDKYRHDGITPWRVQDGRADAEAFLERHMGKVVHARRVQAPEGAAPPTRYCSKNNANVARLEYLPVTFPGCHVVVPLRRPASHAASLLRQHQNFLARQAEDAFVQRYMRDIGHVEFGGIHRPLLVDGFDPDRLDPATADHWLDYWVHVFREVLRHHDRCLFVTQDDLRASPQATMAGLCDALDLPTPGPEVASRFRPTPDEQPTDLFDPRLLAEAEALYAELASFAVTSALRP